MSEKIKIPWCDSTVNFWSGCSPVSDGCENCYAVTLAHLFSKTFGNGAKKKFHISAIKEVNQLNRIPLVNNENSDSYFKKIYDVSNKTGELPFHRRRVFINSMSDWLDDEVPIEWLNQILDIILKSKNIDFLLLTKRPENWNGLLEKISCDYLTTPNLSKWIDKWLDGNPPSNVWIGVTVENQAMAEKRIPELLKIPARVRFVSCEPLLGAVDLLYSSFDGSESFSAMGCVDWVICGGEIGDRARPMHPDWARSLRDQCKVAGVPFFFKQWGEWKYSIDFKNKFKNVSPNTPITHLSIDGHRGQSFEEMKCHARSKLMVRVGHKRAGSLLDGVEHSAFPELKL